MRSRSVWPRTEIIESPRLVLEPLRLEHAEEMLSVLSDQDIYVHTGGEPPSLAALRSRYARQAAGQSPDRSQGWLNWIIRDRETRLAIGTVQATLRSGHGGYVAAELAWVVGVAHQGRGYATEATRAMIGWLRREGIRTFDAHIHPSHGASQAVATHVGLKATDATRDGETLWISDESRAEPGRSRGA
jgi:RimJ/RimL family protein N-acetyltransferase